MGILLLCLLLKLRNSIHKLNTKVSITYYYNHCFFFRSETHKYRTLNLDDICSLNFDSTTFSSNKMLYSSPSPLLCDSPTSQYRGGNLYQKLIKRPSVDSGIHISSGQSSDSLSSLRSKNTKLTYGREIPKLSRFV